MADKDPLTAMRVPGRICVAPSNLSTAYPHGGEDLGLVRDVRLVKREIKVPLRGEGWGRRVDIVDAVFAGEGAALTFALRGWNANAWNRLFDNTWVGTNGGLRGLRFPGSRPPGSLDSDRDVAVLFSPTEPLKHPAVLFPAASPRVAEEQRIPLGRRREDELVVLAGFLAKRKSSNPTGGAWQINLLEDLDLTP